MGSYLHDRLSKTQGTDLNSQAFVLLIMVSASEAALS